MSTTLDHTPRHLDGDTGHAPVVPMDRPPRVPRKRRGPAAVVATTLAMVATLALWVVPSYSPFSPWAPAGQDEPEPVAATPVVLDLQDATSTAQDTDVDVYRPGTGAPFGSAGGFPIELRAGDDGLLEVAPPSATALPERTDS